MRIAKETDFKVDVEGYGVFTFGRRTKDDVYRIRSRYAAITESHYDAEGRAADIGALGFVTLKTLMVAGPEGFDLDAIDPLLDDDFDTKILKIFGALRVREAAFNPAKKVAAVAPAPVAKAAEPAQGEAAELAEPAEVDPPQASLID